MAFSVGLDVGTTAITAAAYFEDGVKAAQSEADTKVIRSAGGACEQDPDAVWAAAAHCLPGYRQSLGR